MNDENINIENTENENIDIPINDVSPPNNETVLTSVNEEGNFILELPSPLTDEQVIENYELEKEFYNTQLEYLDTLKEINELNSIDPNVFQGKSLENTNWHELKDIFNVESLDNFGTHLNTNYYELALLEQLMLLNSTLSHIKNGSNELNNDIKNIRMRDEEFNTYIIEKLDNYEFPGGEELKITDTMNMVVFTNILIFVALLSILVSQFLTKISVRK